MKNVIISTDPGIDDAVAIAIALFHEKLNVQLICPMYGNVDLTYTVTNTEKLVAFFQKKTKIVPGSQSPIIKERINASDIHGDDGMAGYLFPEVLESTVDDSVPAIFAMHQVVSKNHEKTTLIGIGPLTDIALYLHLYPQDREKIEEIVLMGGCLGRGNYGVLSEFNFASDPEAAKMVFDSGLPIRVAPMEVGNQARIMPETSEKIKCLGQVGEMIYQLFSNYRSGSFDSGLDMYDVLAIAMIVESDMFELIETHVAIEIKSELTQGASLIDLENYLQRDNNAVVATSVNRKQFEKWFLEAIKKVSSELK